MPQRLINILIGTVIGLGLVGALWYLAPGRDRAATRTVAETTIKIGGPFALTRHDGTAVTDEAFRGSYMMIYFGYTYCPDVCPLELANMSRALEDFEAAGGNAEVVQPVFVSIDPERDTPEEMAKYVSLFHPRLVGLTGSPEQIAAAARAYRVYYRKAVDEGSASEYLMDHSSIVFLMGPGGDYVTHFAPNTPAEVMAEKLESVVG